MPFLMDVLFTFMYNSFERTQLARGCPYNRDGVLMFVVKLARCR